MAIIALTPITPSSSMRFASLQVSSKTADLFIPGLLLDSINLSGSSVRGSRGLCQNTLSPLESRGQHGARDLRVE